MNPLEIVNMIETEDGYAQQSSLAENDLQKIAEIFSDRFMAHFHYEREKDRHSKERRSHE